MGIIVVIITVIFVSLIYLLIGYGINKDNAKYLLAGYNTMSPQKKQSFDIEKYLKFFNIFFKRLSLYPPLTFVLFFTFLEGDQLIMVWSLSQMLPFIWFTIKSLRFQT
jgi:hypothetical protein